MSSKGDKKTRIALTLKQKTEIHDYKMKFSDLSFETIGKTFSEKWGKNISEMTTIRSYHLIKNQKENGLEQGSA